MGQTDDGANGASPEKKAPSHANTHDVFYGYGTSSMKNQRFTIAIVPMDSSTANVGVAVCSTKDQFNKRVGRMMSHGRAVKRPTLVYAGVDTTTIEGMLELKIRAKTEIAADINAIKDKLHESKK